MKQKTFNWDAVYGEMPESYDMKLSSTLEKLEALSMAKRKVISHKRVTTLIAAMVALLALGCIAYAAAPLIGQVFGHNVEKIEQYEALPEEEKAQQALTKIESYVQEHDVDAEVEFEGIAITLPGIRLMRGMYGDSDELVTSITYSKMPPFDPNWVDFTLSYGGKDYPLPVDDGVAYYREEGNVATTEEELLADVFFGNTQYVDGLLSTTMLFDIPDWQIDEVTPMELRAEINGQQFMIPFAFDPAKAHEVALQRAKENAQFQQEIMAERREEFNGLIENSSGIGIVRHHDGNVITLSEMSYADRFLTFALIVEGDQPEAESKMWGSQYLMDALRVDGVQSTFTGGRGQTNWEGDTEYSIYTKLLNRDERKLPEQSLVYLRLSMQGEKAMEMIFQYNWKTKVVTLPIDAQEEAAWLEEEQSLYDAYDQVSHGMFVFDMKDQEQIFEGDGVRTKVTKVTIDADGMQVFFKYQMKNKKERAQLEDADVKMNGVTVEDDGSMGNSVDTTWEAMKFLPAENMMELDDMNELTIRSKVMVYNKKNAGRDAGQLEMTFKLDKSLATREKTDWELAEEENAGM